ncbi:hypothetical protein HXX25_02750 [Hyphobacterium sp. CCMP332]|uniref:hypothetical protein n=1 Tax=Hyphobacterium sp. CCMP332 TaxID=2749086 RepID=UPI00164F4D68|nr:hypothetical protein [Hyphobacterium sp. CCMP332]QNL18349.1 hypothetical protein HXX25_02750 [Hyphobacterium sp. CCMP332]
MHNHEVNNAIDRLKDEGIAILDIVIEIRSRFDLDLGSAKQLVFNGLLTDQEKTEQNAIIDQIETTANVDNE